MTKQQAYHKALDVISCFKVDYYCIPGIVDLFDNVKDGMEENELVEMIIDMRAEMIIGWNCQHIVSWRYPFLLRRGQKN